jgi:hypothetical protein
MRLPFCWVPTGEHRRYRQSRQWKPGLQPARILTL